MYEAQKLMKNEVTELKTHTVVNLGLPMKESFLQADCKTNLCIKKN